MTTISRLHLEPGATMKWRGSKVVLAVCVLKRETHAKFSDMTEEEVLAMTADDHQKYELERMERNVSEPADSLFVWNRKYLKQYIEKNHKSERKDSTAGFNFYNRIAEFGDSHFRKGEKFLELRRNLAISVVAVLISETWMMTTQGFSWRK